MGSNVVEAPLKPGGVIAGDADVRSVAGDAKVSQAVVLSPTAAVPEVGNAFVLPASARYPAGVLGIVTSETAFPHGETRIGLRPATLDQAYERLHVAMTGTFADTPVTRALRVPQARTASTGASFHLGGSGSRCTGPGATKPITVDLDLSPLHWSLAFISPIPSVHFLVTGKPKITVALGFTGSAECHYTLPLHVVVPIPGTPLVLKMSPVFRLTVESHLQATFTWEPYVTFGFDRGAHSTSIDPHAFNPESPSLDITSGGSAEIFLGASAELSLGGRVGVSADFGPAFTIASEDTGGQTCTTADAGLKLSTSAEADVFVSHWSFTLASGTFFTQHLVKSCTPGTGGPGPSPQPRTGLGKIDVYTYEAPNPPTPADILTPLAGVTVTAQSLRPPGTPPIDCTQSTLVTDSNGFAEFTGCPRGLYALTAVRPGYFYCHCTAPPNVTYAVKPGATTRRDFTLQKDLMPGSEAVAP